MLSEVFAFWCRWDVVERGHSHDQCYHTQMEWDSRTNYKQSRTRRAWVMQQSQGRTTAGSITPVAASHFTEIIVCTYAWRRAAASERSLRSIWMKTAVSSGFATHRMLQQSRTVPSLPVTVKRSPTCSTCSGRAPKYRCSACRPNDLLPTSTNTSFPPLKAQNGSVEPANSDCMASAISSSVS